MKRLIPLLFLFIFSNCASINHIHTITNSIKNESRYCYVGDKLGKRFRTYIQQFCKNCDSQIGETLYGKWSECTVVHYGSDVQLLD
jgi:REP element-mobilizing transposase RayT